MTTPSTDYSYVAAQHVSFHAHVTAGSEVSSVSNINSKDKTSFYAPKCKNVKNTTTVRLLKLPVNIKAKNSVFL